ncbi:hypothetical protein PHAVU_003G010100 [Phaseolus vulgaris]|uniref:PPPDE domain-containing protein n=1 Tax=Phaseolus vulgaris TaxID=3885 RepID=V7C6Z1_PHAVU|nr:hypothetical protein PHAVU_003G010100g [Phaseolus vulgaris]ESW25133.1 hypothetical protein PHAVU_003G010100g [Phaseolus vulgaris]
MNENEEKVLPSFVFTNFLNGVIVLAVYGVEYAFGAHDYSTSGVFEVEPRQCPGFKFRKSIFMGTTSLDPFQIREFMERQSANYMLTGNSNPKWVNRLARIGPFCNCILPDALKTSTVQYDPNFQACDSEKRRLITAFSCLSSISMPQKEVSMSSLFMHSHYKGCLPPWELKKSKKGRLKQKLDE